MIDKAQLVLLGRIVAAHGIRGDVVIDSYTAQPSDIAAYGPLSSADGGKQLDIKVVRVTPKGVVARVGGVVDRNAAEALRGTELYAPRARLPEAEAGEYYYADLAGLRADDEAGNRIGSVVGVQNYGAGDLLEVRLDGQSVTELIAFTDAYVPVVDIAAGRVVVVIPSTADAEAGDEEDLS
ncbi:MAG: ribosome maturation factor RimM [Hyphomicrobium sp.]|nr:ribosome maturation factor RimM [Hyphomicrobium sp.]